MLLRNGLTLNKIFTINDFVEYFNDFYSLDRQNRIFLDYKFDYKSNLNKINIIVQIAELKDAKSITQIFKEVYNGSYPYKRKLDVKEVLHMINNSNHEWIVFKDDLDNIIGCLAVDLEFKEKKGVIHGFAIRRDYQNTVDSLKALFSSLIYLFSKYQNKILIWSAEVRTNNTTSQYYGSLCGLKPISFFPNKDIFYNRVESVFMIISYDDKVLNEYRTTKDPIIIRQVLNCFLYSKKRYYLGIPIVENPNIKFEKKEVEAIRKRINKKTKYDKFGNKYIKISLNNSNSYFKFKFNSFIKTIEKVKYKIVEEVELFTFLKEIISFIQKAEVRYIECFVSSYKPIHQKIFYESGFKPRGYVPCWKYNKKYDVFEDNILFNLYKGKIDKNLTLIQESKDLIQILKNF